MVNKSYKLSLIDTIKFTWSQTWRWYFLINLIILSVGAICVGVNDIWGQDLASEKILPILPDDWMTKPSYIISVAFCIWGCNLYLKFKVTRQIVDWVKFKSFKFDKSISNKNIFLFVLFQSLTWLVLFSVFANLIIFQPESVSLILAIITILEIPFTYILINWGICNCRFPTIRRDNS